MMGVARLPRSSSLMVSAPERRGESWRGARGWGWAVGGGGGAAWLDRESDQFRRGLSLALASGGHSAWLRRTDRSGRCCCVWWRSTESRAAASRARRVFPRRCGSHLPRCFHRTAVCLNVTQLHSRRELSWPIPDVRLRSRCTDGRA
eukprot:COSAG02_NODE_826_length_16718_cov_4813.219628_14_plen_147_part_00